VEDVERGALFFLRDSSLELYIFASSCLVSFGSKFSQTWILDFLLFYFAV
jgi:hypothetical protein